MKYVLLVIVLLATAAIGVSFARAAGTCNNNWTCSNSASGCLSATAQYITTPTGCHEVFVVCTQQSVTASTCASSTTSYKGCNQLTTTISCTGCILYATANDAATGTNPHGSYNALIYTCT